MNKKYIGVGLVVVVIAVVGILYFKQQNPVAAPVEAIPGDFKIKGNPDAPVTITEFSDFQCPACGAAQPVLKQMLQTFQGQIKLDFRHFPLAGHQWSSHAHQAAQCAGLQGKFWSYHDRLFETQRAWSIPKDPTETFLKYASDLELGLDWFATCLTDESVKEVVMANKQEGLDLKVASTPTFFINGERVVGHVNLIKEGVPMIQGILGLPVENFDITEKS